MNQPQQPSSAPNAPMPGPVLEVTVKSDSRTAVRLSRVLALARWRTPSNWALLLAIPLIVLSRRFIEFFVASGRPGWSAASLPLYYLVVLALAAAVGALLTAIRMIKPDAKTAAYTAPGTAISARYHQDSLELVLTTGTTEIPYSKIESLFEIGGGVFLRERGTRGLALPLDLFANVELQAIERRFRGRTNGNVTAWAIRGMRTWALVGVLALVVVVGAAIAIVAQRSSGKGANADGSLPNPCVLTPAQQAGFGFAREDPFDDAPLQRTCDWWPDQLSTDPLTYKSATVFVRRAQHPAYVSGKPYRLGSATDGVDGQEYPLNGPTGKEGTCTVAWTTSFGYVYAETSSSDSKGVDTAVVCRRTENFAKMIFMELPR